MLMILLKYHLNTQKHEYIQDRRKSYPLRVEKQQVFGRVRKACDLTHLIHLN